MFKNLAHIRLTQRLVWLFCIALLLPIAQMAATWHALSHSFAYSLSPSLAPQISSSPLQAAQTRPDERSNGSNDQTPAPSHCDLCMIAAGVSGAALLAIPHVLPLLPARYETPDSPRSNVHNALLVHAYQSRAPPTTSL